MKFALVDNVRQEATPGINGTCPVCGAQCIARCGEKNRNHWAHKSKKDCDHWWEKETFWHRNWKDKFPKEWQEVINYDSVTGEKHVADIKTDTGLVIEFQHSSISPEERKSREAFHKTMVWVANIVNKRDVKLFEGYPQEGMAKKSEMDIPTRWFDSKVPVLFDLSDPEQEKVTDLLYCMLPQTMRNWYKRFVIISKRDFVEKANNGSLKQYLHDLMIEWQQEVIKQKQYDDLCEEVSKNMEILWNYSENFKGKTKNWNVKTIKNTKGWKNIDGKWYIPSGDNSLLLVDRYQGCEFEQRFPVCEGSVKSLSDYYDKITSSKCLMYEGRAYNGELCAGYAIAKCFDKYQDLIYVVCRESKGAFVKKQYERDYGFYSGNAGFEWLKCPTVPCSYNLIVVGLKDAKFIHCHVFDLANWLMERDYEILPSKD